MNTAKLFLLIALFTIGAYVNAQTSLYSFTVHAGVNLSDMDVETIKTDPRFGFRVGAGIEFNLPNKFYIQSGLDLTSKGAELKARIPVTPQQLIIDKQKVDMLYLILPVKAGYRLDVSSAIRMNLSLGPYLGYGIGGKTKYNESYPDNTSRKMEYNTFSDSGVKRFDMGLAGNVGVEYNRFLLNIGYELGLVNYSRNELSAYNNSLYLTLGYRIL